MTLKIKEEIPNKAQDEPLVDLTAALALRSKRTERQQKKQQRKRERTTHGESKTALDLPVEIFLEILTYLRPSDIFRLAHADKSLKQLIAQNEARIVKSIVSLRYPILEKCFRPPVLLEDVDATIHPVLQSEERQEIQSIHRYYQHIAAPDPKVICTCLTCMLRWNALNVVVDFAHYQPYFKQRKAIPMIPRGKKPTWNQKRIGSHALIVTKALRSPLWHALILEVHLKTTVNAIDWHSHNRGNRRARFRMTAEDVASETDAFLGRSGPPTVDIPFHRDNYHMLESFLPNRSWNSEEERWMYMPAEQHGRDVEMVVRWDRWRQQKRAESAASMVGWLRDFEGVDSLRDDVA